MHWIIGKADYFSEEHMNDNLFMLICYMTDFPNTRRQMFY